MAKTIRSNLSNLVKAKNRELGFEMTVAQLSSALGIERPTAYTWLSDAPIRRIEAHIVLAICNYFDCSLEDVLLVVEDESAGQLLAIA